MKSKSKITVTVELNESEARAVEQALRRALQTPTGYSLGTVDFEVLAQLSDAITAARS